MTSAADSGGFFDIKVTGIGLGDAESDSLTLLCGTAANPTIDTNNFCTDYGNTSPYDDVNCIGNGLTGDGSKTIYCRVYDGALYSIDQNTDTYTADNTAPSVSSVEINYSSNLIGVNYDLNMTITDGGSGISGTPTYKCWSSGAGKTRNEAHHQARRLLNQFRIGHLAQKFPRTLSQGEKQRVAVARAIANGAPLVIADEPTGSLESKQGFDIIQLLQDYSKKQSRCVIVASHDLRIAEFADRILRLEDGMLLHVNG